MTDNHDPSKLNDYGKQLYWIAAAQRDMCGELKRVFERGDGDNDSQDKFLDMIVCYIRNVSKSTDKFLDKMVKEGKVLK